MSSESSGQSNVPRRSMLKWTGALAGAVVVGALGGFGADLLMRPNTETTKTVTTTTVSTTTPPPPATISYKPPLTASVQAKVDQVVASLKGAHAGETTAYAVSSEWPPSGLFYFMGGLLKVRMTKGVITSVEPDDSINPGVAIEDKALSWDSILKEQIQQRTPAKHYAYPGFLYHPNRIKYPMKRVGGERGHPGGQFARVSWDEALTTVASMMQATKSKYGNYSIGNNDLESWFGCGVSGWGCDSNEASAFAYRFMFGTGYGSGCGFSDAEESANMYQAKLILLIGFCHVTANATDYQVGYHLRLAREKGVPIILVDPRYTETAETIADQWIPIRPGTDTALGLAIADVLFKENLYNTDYVNKFVEPTGFLKFKDYVLGNSAGPDGSIERTPEWAASITGIPADTIRNLARLYASSKPTFLAMGFANSSKQPLGENPARIFITLQAMMGNIGVAGGSEIAVGGAPYYGISVPFISLGTTPGSFSEPVAPGGPGLYCGWRFPDVVSLRDKLNAGQITEKQYDNLIGNLPGNPLPNIHMMFDTGTGTPGNQRPMINRSYDAIAKLDYYVGVASHGSDPCGLVADMILPAAVWCENDPGFYQTENRFVYQPRLSNPPGEAKTVNWIYLQLAKKLGFGSQFSSKLVNVTVNSSWPDTDWDAAWEGMAADAYSTWAKGTDVAKLNPPSWADFKKNPIFAFPIASVAHSPYSAFASQVQGGSRFPDNVYHTSGKIEVYSNWLATTDPTTTYYGAKIAPMAQWIPMWNSYFTPDEYKKYPLFLLTAHAQMRMHNWVDGNPLLGDVTNSLRDPVHSGDLYQAVLYISPVDAAARGIQDGDQVRAYNDAGEVVVKAVIVPWLVPGSVHLPEGRWGNLVNGRDRRGNANTLTYADRQQTSGSFPQTSICQVERF